MMIFCHGGWSESYDRGATRDAPLVDALVIERDCKGARTVNHCPVMTGWQTHNGKYYSSLLACTPMKHHGPLILRWPITGYCKAVVIFFLSLAILLISHVVANVHLSRRITIFSPSEHAVNIYYISDYVDCLGLLMFTNDNIAVPVLWENAECYRERFWTILFCLSCRSICHKIR